MNFIVYALNERNEGTQYVAIGKARVMADGSMAVDLDALPLGRRLELRKASDGPPDFVPRATARLQLTISSKALVFLLAAILCLWVFGNSFWRGG